MRLVGTHPIQNHKVGVGTLSRVVLFCNTTVLQMTARLFLSQFYGFLPQTPILILSTIQWMELF